MQSQKRGHHWKGGIITDSYGYICIWMPTHHRASRKGYVKQHILEAEKALGKPLPDKAVVHHHSPDQLVICQNQAYHVLLHQREKAIKACGHASWRRCWVCKEWDDPSNMYYPPKELWKTRHPQCFNEYQKKIRIQRIAKRRESQ